MLFVRPICGPIRGLFFSVDGFLFPLCFQQYGTCPTLLLCALFYLYSSLSSCSTLSHGSCKIKMTAQLDFALPMISFLFFYRPQTPDFSKSKNRVDPYSSSSSHHFFPFSFQQFISGSFSTLPGPTS
ncbi:hypothetical protein ILYODFUR_013700 [Ilyodon furcidens]|uniref:Uncharacterized protein n=1 Tax=Ilyodon furcidens TaxID=33524 RepID=A0ABV0TUL6_9TELE